MMDWNTPITATPEDEQKTGDFPVAVPGKYEFTVRGIAGKQFPGSEKTAACPMLTLDLVVDGKDERGRDLEVRVFENIMVNEKNRWKLVGFAKCVDIYHDGITPAEIMKQGVGRIGKADFGIREYNGSKYNNIKHFHPAADDLPF